MTVKSEEFDRKGHEGLIMLTIIVSMALGFAIGRSSGYSSGFERSQVLMGEKIAKLEMENQFLNNVVNIAKELEAKPQP